MFFDLFAWSEFPSRFIFESDFTCLYFTSFLLTLEKYATIQMKTFMKHGMKRGKYRCSTTNHHFVIPLILLFFAHPKLSSCLSSSSKRTTSHHRTATATIASVVAISDFSGLFNMITTCQYEEMEKSLAKAPIVAIATVETTMLNMYKAEKCRLDKCCIGDRISPNCSLYFEETRQQFKASNTVSGKNRSDRNLIYIWSWMKATLYFMSCRMIAPLLLPKSQLRWNISVFVETYLKYLDTYPLMTKSITAGIIGGIGDFVSQIFERNFQSREKCKPESAFCGHTHKYDYQRTLAIFSEGLFISGPLMHIAYDAFESLLPITDSEGIMGWIVAGIHVAADTFIMDTFFVLTAISVSGLLEGVSIRNQLIPQLLDEFIPTVKAAWASSFILCPLQFVCFRYLPLSLRVFAMNCQDIIWNAVVSFMAHRHRQKHV